MIDLTVKLSQDVFVWWGDSPFEVFTEEYEGIKVSSISMSLHTGTHIDLPQHFGFDGPDVPDVWIGNCEILPIRSLPHCAGVEAVFIRTGQGDLIELGRLGKDFVSLSLDYVRDIRRICRNLRFVGIDAPSVDFYGCEDVHRYLLGNGIFIVESLKIPDQVHGIFKAVIAPLKIEGVEAYPAKVFLLGEV